MAPRFTVIQGGLSEQAEPAGQRTWQVLDRAAGWQVDLRRLEGVDAHAGSARRAVLVRNIGTDPRRDFDHLPPLAQHRSAGHSVALAWDRDAEIGREVFQGVEPWAMPYPVRGDRAPSCTPPETEIAGLVAQAAAEAVDRAVKARLRTLRRPIRLVGAAEPVRVSSPVRPAPAANRSTRPPTVPATAFIGIRPVGWDAAAAPVRPLTESAALRDPAAVSQGRLVGRFFRGWGALRIEFLRRAGEVVAGTRRLGTGAASAPWRRARA
ncbi:hypothetical protein SAMN05216360_113193 [Methylobacterium phyllostachyos]|uniref:Uncharacterized protein n=1 Tax=Methylobacterium phyllostachyos TaxID=582672 RepID=A0A1H0G0S4_9HYPH|nr:hypothetical protein [Methylobacterium phyllostachyos]SDO00528.1 hypothetical protein SAMN05216360_113193 [Methylobacterium phyllostachyos]